MEGDLGLLPLGDLDKLEELGDFPNPDGERGDLPPGLMPVLPALEIRIQNCTYINIDW